ncbi:hypothetical protein BHM03_00006115 [Ensete ventricosum]|uniref:RING-CH-type domain-containing protein n=1 Tax=Ensete ventricosum TaxID=4639 RepID=A0A445MBJ5_ENSVE|nr:hypothetical protein BHM03_00006115 [Ensete ventricosum]
MGDHVVLHVDRLITPQTIEAEGGSASSAEAAPVPVLTLSSKLEAGSGDEKGGEEESKVAEEKEPLIQMVDCRICQEEDHIKNLEAPCACSGSLKLTALRSKFLYNGNLLLSCSHLDFYVVQYAHRACVQRWCNEKGDITCEICHELMALLLLRHALTITSADGDDDDDDASTYFSVIEN